MSILIVAVPRSGSTMLCRVLSKVLDYDFVMEPFNTKTARHNIDLSTINKETPIVVKTMIEQFPKDESFQKKHPEIFDSKNVSVLWNEYFSKRFKHVIILDRKDAYDQCISLTNAQMNTNRHLTQLWHVPYRAVIDEKKIDKCLKVVSGYKSSLEFLYSRLNQKPSYYEFIYNKDPMRRARAIKHITEGIENFNIHKYVEYTDPKNRYRQESKGKGLI